jgi:hypothetical protein
LGTSKNRLFFGFLAVSHPAACVRPARCDTGTPHSKMLPKVYLYKETKSNKLKQGGQNKRLKIYLKIGDRFFFIQGGANTQEPAFRRASSFQIL